MKLFLNIILAVFIFAGCSSKQYFEPEDTSDLSVDSQNMSSIINSINKDGATLEDFRMVNKDGISNYSLAKGYSFINQNNKVILSSDKLGNLMIDKVVVNFKQNVVSATIEDNLLAVVFSDNSLALYDMTTKKFRVKKQLKHSALNDTRIASPIFISDIVAFPSLDGKIIIINLSSNEIIKSINIDPNGQINNVIFLTVIGDTMLAATSNTIMYISDDSFSIKDYEIKDIISTEKNIYISTIDGTIIKFNLQLKELASKKFKFAKIYSLGFGTSLYALESQGYLIKLNDDFTQNTIYDFSFDETKKTIAIGDTLYFDDEYIKLP